LEAVSFIPLLARLAIEFSFFEENVRGGLLIAGGADSNVFNSSQQVLILTPTHDKEHHELLDRK
jgi:hypothetical protein